MSDAEPAVSPKRLRYLVRPRATFERFVAPLVELYRDRREVLYLPGFEPERLLADLAAYQGLLAREAAARAELQAIERARRAQGASVWTRMLAIYARARSVARDDLDMRARIDAFVRFLRPRRPRAKPDGSRPGA